MQARCPHCRNVFATDRAGVQFCPHCGKEIDVPEPPAGATTGSEPGAPVPVGPMAGFGGPQVSTSERTGPAWEHRRELGFFPALVGTWKSAMFNPTAFWNDVRPNGPAWDAILYAWILYAVQAVVSIPFSLVQLQGNAYGNLADRIHDPNVARWVRTLSEGGSERTTRILGLFVVGILIFPLLLVIGSAILHLFALLFGASKNGYWATLRVVAYALAPSLFNFVPCVSLFASAYVLVLIILGLSSVQETTGGRASAAAITPFVLSCCCSCGLASLLVAPLAAALGNVH